MIEWLELKSNFTEKEIFSLPLLQIIKIIPKQIHTNDYENFEKGMIYMKILKKGG
jgi:hypothetical protein